MMPAAITPCELLRIHLPRTPLNKGKKQGRGCYATALGVSGGGAGAPLKLLARTCKREGSEPAPSPPPTPNPQAPQRVPRERVTHVKVLGAREGIGGL